jgi:hypothetical protein
MAFFEEGGRSIGVRRMVRRSAGVTLLILAGASIRCSEQKGGDYGDGDGDESVGARPSTDLTLGYTAGGANGSAYMLDPLCGSGSCVPDSATACKQPGMGGAGGEGSEATGGLAGGINYDPGDLEERGVACQVHREPGCEGSSCGIQRACVSSGVSAQGEPCVSASDCRPGLACVGEGVSGVCRPYCCRGTERSCAPGTFCDARSIPEAPEVFVPVCIPVDGCDLTDPFPCPSGQDCTCQGDRACVVVRADGATACTVPGAGQSGDPCTAKVTAECAHGFVCSPSAGCMKLCSTVQANPSCPNSGTCQSPSEFPPELGVCVGVNNGSTAAR